ncbi:unnamed protein product [Zymoseptoria tritici ST99CH_3D1]|nr:unnamed protein product [Zymoseptoria tritici ST99CH_3D1]
MSSGQTYPTMTSTMDSNNNMALNVGDDIVCTEWYHQPIYAYNDPYNTPFPTSTFPSSTFPTSTFPSSTVESEQWNQFVRSSIPDIDLASYSMQQPIQQQMTPQPVQMPSQPGYLTPQTNNSNRPRSSSNGLNRSSDPNPLLPSGLGIQFSSGQPTPPVTSTFPPEMSHYSSASTGQPTPPVTSTFPPEMFSAYAMDTPSQSRAHTTRRSSRPQQQHQQSRTLAPSTFPEPTPNLKRTASFENESPPSNQQPSKRPRLTTSTTPSSLLNEEDRLLVHLREDLALPWKEVIARFKSSTGKPFQIAQLQMRYKRLREKYRVWEESDTEALKKAVEEWERCKWEIVSAKMLSYGVEEKWPPGMCGRKWRQLELANGAIYTTQSMTPVTTSQMSSPVDGAFVYPFLPIQ